MPSSCSSAMAFAIARLGIDDYAGIDVRGKIVVALPGAARRRSNEVSAHLKSTQARMAGAQGAIGVIEIEDAAQRRGPRSGASQPARGRLGRCAGPEPANGPRLTSGQRRARIGLARAPVRASATQVVGNPRGRRRWQRVRGFPLPASISSDRRATGRISRAPKSSACSRERIPRWRANMWC